MMKKYIKFFINGVVIATIAWCMQQVLYQSIPGDSAQDYAIASSLTLIPLVCVNFIIQSKLIFNRPGLLQHFILTDLFIMLIVTALAPLCRQLINLLLGVPWGNKGGFILAAILASIPSYLLRYYWVFSNNATLEK